MVKAADSERGEAADSEKEAVDSERGVVVDSDVAGEIRYYCSWHLDGVIPSPHIEFDELVNYISSIPFS